MNIIFTNHAKSRIKERSFEESAVLDTVKKPDSISAGHQKGTLEYARNFGISKVTAIVRENDRKELIILSCWIDPPIAGTKDAKKHARYLKYKKAGILEKIAMDILSIFGL